MQDNSITHYSFISHEKDILIIRHVTLHTIGLCSGPSGDYRQQHDASAADQCQTMGLGKGRFDGQCNHIMEQSVVCCKG